MEIFMAISEQPFYTNLDKARIAAKIARDLAHDAYEQGASDSANYYQGYGRVSFKKFIQDYD